MPTLIGIDEAGYGPNLGPFVLSIAVAEVPERHDPSDLYQLFARTVSKQQLHGKLWVADSKKIYSSGGIARLEANLLPFLDMDPSCTLNALWRKCCVSSIKLLQQEPCYQIVPDDCGSISTKVTSSVRAEFAAAGITIDPIRFVPVFPEQFNDLTEAGGTKAFVEHWALEQLLTTVDPNPGPVLVQIDKLGGRSHYHTLLQTIFSDAFVSIRHESPVRSIYQFKRRGVEWQITFEAKSDGHHFLPALASMLSKYVRERLMQRFNAFWQQQVPGLRPTAGYPVDAKRFWQDISAVRQRLEIPDRALWRKK